MDSSEKAVKKVYSDNGARSVMRRVRQNIGVYFMVMPFFVLLFLFIIVPVFFSLATAFTDFDAVNAPRFAGLSSFGTALKYGNFGIAFFNTLGLAFLVGVLGFVLSFFAAWLINQTPKISKGIFTFLFFVPALSGNVFATWRLVFSNDIYGFLNSFLMEKGIIIRFLPFLSGFMLLPVLMIQLWMSFGIGFLSMLTGMREIPRERYEAAAIEGVRSCIQELVYITLPAMKPYLLFAAILQIPFSFGAGEIRRTMSYGIDDKTQTLIDLLYKYGADSYEMGLVAAVCLIIFIFMLIFYILIKVLFKHINGAEYEKIK